jgi:hypothetical protein
MTYIVEAQVIANHADRPYMTIHEVLRVGKRRATTRIDMVAAQSTWYSEGGANEAGD